MFEVFDLCNDRCGVSKHILFTFVDSSLLCDKFGSIPLGKEEWAPENNSPCNNMLFVVFPCRLGIAVDGQDDPRNVVRGVILLVELLGWHYISGC